MKVTTPPLLKVEVKVAVICGGANEVVCPRLLVVWIKTVLENVVVGPSEEDVLGVLSEVALLELLDLEELVESTEEDVEVG